MLTQPEKTETAPDENPIVIDNGIYLRIVKVLIPYTISLPKSN